MKTRVRTSTVIVHQHKLLCFRAIDPFDGREFYFLPGGGIEPNETAPEAAVRETLEETGYDIQVSVESAIDEDYQFYWNGEHFDVLTIFYRGYLIDPQLKPLKLTEPPYHKGVYWIDLKDIDTYFSYSPEILLAIKNLIDPS